MELRDAGMITSRREGRFIYYRIADGQLLALLKAAASYLGIDPQPIDTTTGQEPQEGCNCPKCNRTSDPLIAPDQLLQI
jgi:hypothetical protein